MDPTVANYRRLDAHKVIETVQTLQTRIEKRFPGSGLGKIAAELLRVAQEAVERTRWIQKPNLPLLVAIISMVAGLLVNIRQFQMNDYGNFIQALEATVSSVVFVGATVIFLVSWETRIKRNRALKAVNELRALAHIVDMHQLTKDPESYFGRLRPAPPTKRDLTPFELNRYLDYCSELLALLSKIAALYVQEFQDPVLLDAVDDVEDLASGLSRKIWQKLTILESLTRSLPAERGEEGR
jgi:hypothetical protein